VHNLTYFIKNRVIVFILSSFISHRIKFAASSVLEKYTRRDSLDPLVIEMICERLRVSYFETRIKEYLLRCLKNVLAREKVSVNDFRKILNKDILSTLNYLMCNIHVPDDNEIIGLIDGIIRCIKLFHLESLSSGKFLYPILLKLSYSSDDEIVLRSVKHLHDVFSSLHISRCKLYTSGNEFYQLIYSKGILYRLHQLLTQHQSNNEWLKAILHLLVDISFGPAHCLREIIDFSFIPMLCTISQAKTLSKNTYYPLSILLEKILFEADDEVLLEAGIMSEVINLGLQSCWAFNDMLISFAGISSPAFQETVDVQNVQQKVRIILLGIKQRLIYPIEKSFSEKTIKSMLNYKVL
jgi:hypothetical protein